MERIITSQTNTKRTNNNIVLLEEDAEIRTAVNLTTGEVYYSVVDVFYILNDFELRKFAREFWYSIKHRLKDKPFVSKYFECHKVNVLSLDGKRHPSDFLDFEHLFSIVEYCNYAKVIGYGGVRMPQRVSADNLEEDKTYLNDLLNKYSKASRIDVDEVKAS